jgi:hypothetical protein
MAYSYVDSVGGTMVLLLSNMMLRILNTTKSWNGNKGFEIQILQDFNKM